MSENLPVKMEDVVRERMKAIIGDVIPDEQWDAMIRREHERFVREELPKLVRGELMDQYKAAIKELFARPEWQARWAEGEQMASEKLNEMLVAAAPLVLANMIGGSMQQVLYQFQQQLQGMVRY